jgi:hypothetical protein
MVTKTHMAASVTPTKISHLQGLSEPRVTAVLPMEGLVANRARNSRMAGTSMG